MSRPGADNGQDHSSILHGAARDPRDPVALQMSRTFHLALLWSDGLPTIRGVSEVVSGYTGGETAGAPRVHRDDGHAEAVAVCFDRGRAEDVILDVFFTLHDLSS